MSSNDIVYTDDESDAESIIFETEEETMFKMNDINPVKKSLDEMEKEELLEIIKKDKKMSKYLSNSDIKKNIYIKNKLINIII